MRYKLFNAAWDSNHRIVVLAMTAIVILVVIVAMLSYKLSKSNERIVILPTTVNKAYEIQWDQASSEYYKEMAVWLSGMMGSVTPKTVGRTANTVEPFFAPNIRKNVVESLHASVALMPTKVNYVAWFLPIEKIYEPQTRKIFITGYLSSSLTSSKRADKRVTYEYRLTMVDGKPLVTSFDSYNGKARTQLYIMSNKQRLQKEQQLENQLDRSRQLEMERTQADDEDMQLMQSDADFDVSLDNSTSTQSPTVSDQLVTDSVQ
jgi:conjugal transfer pilus assembly protein TraE